MKRNLKKPTILHLKQIKNSIIPLIHEFINKYNAIIAAPVANFEHGFLEKFKDLSAEQIQYLANIDMMVVKLKDRVQIFPHKLLGAPATTSYLEQIQPGLAAIYKFDFCLINNDLNTIQFKTNFFNFLIYAEFPKLIRKMLEINKDVFYSYKCNYIHPILNSIEKSEKIQEFKTIYNQLIKRGYVEFNNESFMDNAIRYSTINYLFRIKQENLIINLLKKVSDSDQFVKTLTNYDNVTNSKLINFIMNGNNKLFKLIVNKFEVDVSKPITIHKIKANLLDLANTCENEELIKFLEQKSLVEICEPTELIYNLIRAIVTKLSSLNENNLYSNNISYFENLLFKFNEMTHKNALKSTKNKFEDFINNFLPEINDNIINDELSETEPEKSLLIDNRESPEKAVINESNVNTLIKDEIIESEVLENISSNEEEQDTNINSLLSEYIANLKLDDKSAITKELAKNIRKICLDKNLQNIALESLIATEDISYEDFMKIYNNVICNHKYIQSKYLKLKREDFKINYVSNIAAFKDSECTIKNNNIDKIINLNDLHRVKNFKNKNIYIKISNKLKLDKLTGLDNLITLPKDSTARNGIKFIKNIGKYYLKIKSLGDERLISNKIFKSENNELIIFDQIIKHRDLKTIKVDSKYKFMSSTIDKTLVMDNEYELFNSLQNNEVEMTGNEL